MRTLAIDADDCLGEYAVTFIDYARSSGMEIDESHIGRSFVEMGIPGDWMRDFEDQYLSTLPVVPGSQEAVKELSKHFRLFCVTSRSTNRSGVTDRWVYDNFPEIQWVSYSWEKGEVCKRMRAVALIDDQLRFAEQFTPTLVYAQTWNKEWKGARGDWPYLVQQALLLAK